MSWPTGISLEYTTECCLNSVMLWVKLSDNPSVLNLMPKCPDLSAEMS